MSKFDRENVLVILFKSKSLEFLVLKRKISPVGVWQPVSGGIELQESHVEAVIREIFEETGVKDFIRIIDLKYSFEFDVESSNRKMIDYCFAMEVEDNISINISEEHSEFVWLNYTKAYKLLSYNQNKIALNKLRLILGF